MTLTQRIGKVLRALALCLTAWAMVKLGEYGLFLVSALLSFGLIVFGARKLVYYFTMARHMVDGRSILYLGVIAFDFGIFTLSIADQHGVFIVLYWDRKAKQKAMDEIRAEAQAQNLKEERKSKKRRK